MGGSAASPLESPSAHRQDPGDNFAAARGVRGEAVTWAGASGMDSFFPDRQGAGESEPRTGSAPPANAGGGTRPGYWGVGGEEALWLDANAPSARPGRTLEAKG